MLEFHASFHSLPNLQGKSVLTHDACAAIEKHGENCLEILHDVSSIVCCVVRLPGQQQHQESHTADKNNKQNMYHPHKRTLDFNTQNQVSSLVVLWVRSGGIGPYAVSSDSESHCWILCIQMVCLCCLAGMCMSNKVLVLHLRHLAGWMAVRLWQAPAHARMYFVLSDACVEADV